MFATTSADAESNFATAHRHSRDGNVALRRPVAPFTAPEKHRRAERQSRSAEMRVPPNAAIARTTGQEEALRAHELPLQLQHFALLLIKELFVHAAPPY